MYESQNYPKPTIMKTPSRLVLTADGSHSVYNTQIGQHYHSVYGAREESERVYIELGLQAAFNQFDDEPLRVFEMGFGTGLNALLTMRESEKQKRSVEYETVETHPLPLEEAHQLNYDGLLGTTTLSTLHEAPWGISTAISPLFTLTKHEARIQDFRTTNLFHLIYYDAFSPKGQPELWTADLFTNLAELIRPGGILTTYCVKGYVQRNLQAASFKVEKHPGPPHKRQVIRAIRV
ncbi:MAG: tRNA (5-methylaminomethyl-2-thiouridine)(34)-methyltransferase MnmD [Gemmataceae bacterium]